MQLIRDWFRYYFSDPQVVILMVLLILGSVFILLLGNILAPFIASVVIAYLLEGLVGLLERSKVPRLAAVLIVFLGFMVFLAFLMFILLPLLWQQLGQFLQQLPSMISWGQRELLRLPERYPDYITEQQVIDLINVLRAEVTLLGQRVLSFSVASVRSIINIIVYLFLMPFLVFFLLKDKVRLLRWLTRFLPADRSLATKVWRDVDRQIGNYVRGKVWEILIVWAASSVTYTIMGLQFSMLVGFLIGISVLVPYIGATVMVFPVASVGFFQWGWSSDYAYAVSAYVVIQILDGNLLAPLLFSEVVNLHPVAIIVAILVFGGFWGFWGVFFAIPLATVVEAVLKAWPSKSRIEAEEGLT
jgi:putative permease